MKRRTFLKAIPVGVGMLTFCSRDKDRYVETGTTGDAMYDRFKSPVNTAKPFFRWWWNDNRVTKKEVRRELRLMAACGVGGVEINPIALPEIYRDLPGEPLTWLGREWKEVLSAAVQEAHDLGMIVDMIIGTGWPFGGDFLRDDETIQGVELHVQRIEGPVSLEKKIDIPDDADHKLMQIKLFPTKIKSLDDAIDLTLFVDEQGILRADIPNGDWDLYIVSWRNTFRQVMFGARGADGPVLDHFNKQAVRKYLNRTSDALNPLFGGVMGNKIRAVFCDSIELSGANWTTDLPDEFRMRNGYDLDPWLPLLLAGEAPVDRELADRLRRVRYDFSKTLADLFMERFILVFHDWCVQNGVASRYQAYGHPWLYTDLLDGYLVPDIPEGDQWLFNGGWVKRSRIDDIRYAIWNKYASSGGHLAGKKIISSEAMTNTRGVFEATLEYIKQATDLDVVGGINHFVLHGFNYSPPEAAFPGWIRFGTWFNENNPWQPYFKRWADYAARLSQVFQDSQFKAEVAILGPTPDVWREHGLDRTPWALTPDYLHDLWQALNHHGYCSDYVNATILQNADFEDGALKYGPMSYDLLICADVSTLEPATAGALFNFAENGGRILFINETPSRSPGLSGADRYDLVVEETTAALLREHPERVKRKKFRRGDLTTWIGKRLRELAVAPAVHISNPDERLFMIHHVADDRDIYFFCNSHRDKAIEFTATFPASGKTPWLWDAESGEKYVFGAADEPLSLTLKPLQSLLLVFQEDDGPVWRPVETDEKKFIAIPGPWKTSFAPMRGEPFEKLLPTLFDLSTKKELQNFSGIATYRTNFLIKKAEKAVLDLGQVYDIAEVSLNGKPLGVRWWGEKRFVVDDELVDGVNTLEVKVTTTAFNAIQSLKGNPVVDYWLKRRKNTGLLSSGLAGPVRLYKILPSKE